VDFALQALLGPDLSQVQALVWEGAVSFEIFLGLIDQKIEETGKLVAALEAVRDAGGIAGITPYDDGLAAASPDLPPEVEAAGVARALCAHRIARGRVHLRQISSALGLAGKGVTSEVTPNNLLLTGETLTSLGAVAKVVPPLRPEADALAMRHALAAGRISIVATDHAPHAPQEKDAGTDKARGGFPGVQTMLPLLLRLVAEAVLSYADLSRVACERPARIFGLYPRKGSCARALTPTSSSWIRRARCGSATPTRPPHAVRRLDRAGDAAHDPFLRGELIARDGAIVGAPRGRFLAPVVA
jgi:dihydroorotase